MIDLRGGDCREVMREMIAEGVQADAVVCDPPYGLSEHGDIAPVLAAWAAGEAIDPGEKRKGFMGKSWDGFVPGPEYWRLVFALLKPGGHALVFAGSRTSDLMGIALRLAGLEIRDQIMWVRGQGFPKSHNVSKAIDKAAGASTAAAREWDGWGTALKPAHEPIWVARKPLAEKSVAANVLAHGTGAINVDGCRVASDENLNGRAYATVSHKDLNDASTYAMPANGGEFVQPQGRFPANLIHDGSDEVEAVFAKAGERKVGDLKPYTTHSTDGYSGGWGTSRDMTRAGDTGSASRFFYCAKASKSDRSAGLEDGAANTHPTVKPTALMAYLCRLVCPPNGTVLDPFMGSGSTGKAAAREGFRFIGIEREAEYLEIARRRIEHEQAQRADAATLFDADG